MTTENQSSIPAPMGARTIAQDSAEVQKIGALLRGEKVVDDAAKGEEGKTAELGTVGAQPAAGAGDPAADGAQAVSGDDTAGEAAGNDEPLTLAELAKSLGAKEGELYDQVKVEVEVLRDDGSKGREAVSLGELRRGYVGAAKLEKEREQFDRMRDEKSLEFMNTRAELEQLGATIAPYAPREVVERMEAQLEQRNSRERVLLLEAIPEWKDSAAFTADRAKMVDFLKPWGFSLSDVYAIADHRIARFVRDMAKREQRKAEAERAARERGNGAIKKGQSPDGRQSTPPLRARLANIVRAGRASTTLEGKTDAIGALLRTTQRK